MGVDMEEGIELILERRRFEAMLVARVRFSVL